MPPKPFIRVPKGRTATAATATSQSSTTASGSGTTAIRSKQTTVSSGPTSKPASSAGRSRATTPSSTVAKAVPRRSPRPKFKKVEVKENKAWKKYGPFSGAKAVIARTATATGAPAPPANSVTVPGSIKLTKPAAKAGQGQAGKRPRSDDDAHDGSSAPKSPRTKTSSPDGSTPSASHRSNQPATSNSTGCNPRVRKIKISTGSRPRRSPKISPPTLPSPTEPVAPRSNLVSATDATPTPGPAPSRRTTTPARTNPVASLDVPKMEWRQESHNKKLQCFVDATPEVRKGVKELRDAMVEHILAKPGSAVTASQIKTGAKKHLLALAWTRRDSTGRKRELALDKAVSSMKEFLVREAKQAGGEIESIYDQPIKAFADDGPTGFQEERRDSLRHSLRLQGKEPETKSDYELPDSSDSDRKSSKKSRKRTKGTKGAKTAKNTNAK